MEVPLSGGTERRRGLCRCLYPCMHRTHLADILCRKHYRQKGPREHFRGDGEACPGNPVEMGGAPYRTHSDYPSRVLFRCRRLVCRLSLESMHRRIRKRPEGPFRRIHFQDLGADNNAYHIHGAHSPCYSPRGKERHREILKGGHASAVCPHRGDCRLRNDAAGVVQRRRISCEARFLPPHPRKHCCSNGPGLLLAVAWRRDHTHLRFLCARG